MMLMAPCIDAAHMSAHLPIAARHTRCEPWASAFHTHAYGEHVSAAIASPANAPGISEVSYIDALQNKIQERGLPPPNQPEAH